MASCSKKGRFEKKYTFIMLITLSRLIDYSNDSPLLLREEVKLHQRQVINTQVYVIFGSAIESQAPITKPRHVHWAYFAYLCTKYAVRVWWRQELFFFFHVLGNWETETTVSRAETRLDHTLETSRKIRARSRGAIGWPFLAWLVNSFSEIVDRF